MTRRIVLWLVLVSASAGMALNASMRARAQEDHLAEINRSIASEEDRIRVLSAEWSSLKSPDRLETLASRHLDGLGRIKPTQMASLADIPEINPEAPEAAPPAIATALATAPTTAPAPVVVASAATPVAAPKAAVSKPVTQQVAQQPEAKTTQEKTASSLNNDALAAIIHNSEDDTDAIASLIERDPAPRLVLASAGRAE